jgi:hypothetical protein
LRILNSKGNLIFANGVQLPNPARLLTGDGKCTWHIGSELSEEIKDPELLDLTLATLGYDCPT